MVQHLQPTGGNNNKGSTEDGDLTRSPGEDHDKVWKFKVGFYFAPEEHFDRAICLKHPALQFHVVPDILRRNLFQLCTMGTKALAQQRIAVLKEVMKLKLELASEEKRVRAEMDVHVNTVTKNKALALWRRLLTDTNIPDMSVCDSMEKGVPLTGLEAESPLYHKRYAPAVITVEQLDHQAPGYDGKTNER